MGQHPSIMIEYTLTSSGSSGSINLYDRVYAAMVNTIANRNLPQFTLESKNDASREFTAIFRTKKCRWLDEVRFKVDPGASPNECIATGFSRSTNVLPEPFGVLRKFFTWYGLFSDSGQNQQHLQDVIESLAEQHVIDSYRSRIVQSTGIHK